MKKVMRISDAFNYQDIGVVLSGHSEDLDLMDDDDIRGFIGETVKILTRSKGELVINKIAVDIGTSLLGKKNINILIGSFINIDDIVLDSEVVSF